MSQKSANSVTQIIECPHCQTQFECVMWHVVDSVENPNAYADLMAGNLCLATCPNCQETTLLAYPLVYNNAAESLVVALIPEEVDEAARARCDKLVADCVARQQRGQVTRKAVTVRQVRDMPTLIEKAMIFRDGLDDRIVEMMKSICKSQANRAGMGIAYVRYWKEGEDKTLLCFDDEDNVVNAAQLRQDAYQHAVQIVGGHVDTKATVVDEAWAESLLGRPIEEAASLASPAQ